MKEKHWSIVLFHQPVVPASKLCFCFHPRKLTWKMIHSVKLSYLNKIINRYAIPYSPNLFIVCLFLFEFKIIEFGSKHSNTHSNLRRTDTNMAVQWIISFLFYDLNELTWKIKKAVKLTFPNQDSWALHKRRNFKAHCSFLKSIFCLPWSSLSNILLCFCFDENWTATKRCFPSAVWNVNNRDNSRFAVTFSKFRPEFFENRLGK